MKSGAVVAVLLMAMTDVECVRPVTNWSRLPRLNGSKDSNRLVSAVEQIQDEGFLVEEHRIVAEDAQMLTLHRIMVGSHVRGQGRGPPVLLMHGYLGSSHSWLTLPRSQALPYLLADWGYDVWLGNFRTNYYSRSHLNYSAQDSRFWDVTYNEIGVYDLPANIDHILRETKHGQLVYIGHSMGTTTLLVMLSSRPTYNRKVRAAFLLSPILLPISPQRLTPLLRMIFPHLESAYMLLHSQRRFEFLPRNRLVMRVIEKTCGPGALQPLCLEFFAQRHHLPDKNVDLKDFGRVASEMASGTSIKITHHLLQLFSSGMRHYDYGDDTNLRVYGTRTPPLYDLTAVTAPLYIYYGLNDVLTDPKGVKKLRGKLKSTVYLEPVKDPHFTHNDFLIGNNAKQVLYLPIIAQINHLYTDRRI